VHGLELQSLPGVEAATPARDRALYASTRKLLGLAVQRAKTTPPKKKEKTQGVNPPHPRGLGRMTGRVETAPVRSPFGFRRSARREPSSSNARLCRVVLNPNVGVVIQIMAKRPDPYPSIEISIDSLTNVLRVFLASPCCVDHDSEGFMKKN
jgi:hypothetical protein